MPIAVRDVTWSETEEAVRVVVPLKGVKPSKVDIFSTDSYLKVSYPPFLYEAHLYDVVDDNESNALVGNGKVSFTLVKRKQCLWGQLKKGEIPEGQSLKENGEKEEDCVLSKEEAQRLRNEAVETAHEKARQEEQEKAVRKEEEKRQAVKEQIKLDDEERGRVLAAKEQASKQAMVELEEWKEEQTRREEESSKTRVTKRQLTEPAAASRTARSKQRHKKDIFQAAPPPRSGGTITVSFTPRIFPTPSRESKVDEEEEWMKKMTEASRMKAENDKDLGDVEERDPLWLKDKGNEFYRQGNYQAAINAYGHAVRRGGGMPSIFSNRAACYLQLERHQECIKDCTFALDLLEPPIPANLQSRKKAYVRRGTGFARLELYAEALKDYQSALQLSPENPELQTDADRIRSIIQGSRQT